MDSNERSRAFAFGPFLLNPTEHYLLRDGQAVSLAPKAFKTLVVLVTNSGHLVEKDELLREVWPDTVVEEATLAQIVFKLRKLLGEAANGGKYIETVPKCGYRFIAEAQNVPGPSTAPTLERETSASVVVGSDLPNADAQTAFTNASHAASHGNTDGTGALIRGPLTAPRTALLLLTGNKYSTVALLAILAASGILLGGYALFVWRQSTNRSTTPFRTPHMTRVTNSGNVKDAAVSPDGRYIVFVTEDQGLESLWVRQVATKSVVRLTAPAETDYYGLTLSHDGNFIYYLKSTQNKLYALYRLSLLGGTPNEVIPQVDSPIALSPDDTRLAFMRKNFNQAERTLFVANADGTEERALVTRKAPEIIGNPGPSWSPDGTVIAYILGNTAIMPRLTVIGIQVKDGAERTITQGIQGIARMVWASNSRGLFISASEGPIAHRQIWYVPYSDGQPERITNDLGDYDRINLTADSSTLLSVQKETFSSIWIRGPKQDSDSTIRIGAGNYFGYLGLCLTPDGRVVYSSNANENHDIWIMNADGTNQKQLTSQAGYNIFPTVSPDARTIIFVSDRTGHAHLWSMNLDGSHQRQLTNGGAEVVPQCTPNARSVIYQGIDADGMTIWEVPIDGGAAVRLTDTKSMMPVVSPDGNNLAYYYFDEQKSHWRIAVKSMMGANLIKTFDMPSILDPYFPVTPMRWAPDGRALAYADSRDGVSNIWSLPLDGSTPRQLTHFNDTDTRIGIFEWTRDGKRFVCSRSKETSDIVMITEEGDSHALATERKTHGWQSVLPSRASLRIEATSIFPFTMNP